MNNFFFQVPDKAIYYNLNNLDAFKISKISELLNIYGKLRIILPKKFYSQIEKILQKQCNFTIHPTTFFKTKITQDFYINKLKNFLTGKKLKLEKIDKGNLQILQDFMLGSYATEKNMVDWGNLLNSSIQKVYLIQNLETHSPVATFSLVNLETEIQLQSVGGNSTKYSKFESPKLPIIMAFVCKEILEKNYSENLVFSSSKEKLINIYQNLGFQTTDTFLILKLEKKL